LPPKLLVSVTTVREAEVAAASGADIIDVKNPSEGAMGANFPWVISSIRVRLPGVPLSATLGDMPEIPGTAALAALGAATLKVDYLKVGLLGPRSIASAARLLSSVKRAVGQVDASVKIVAGSYADWKQVGSMHPKDVVKSAAQSSIDGLMLDMMHKSDRSSLDELGGETLTSLVEDAHNAGLSFGLAGGLRLNHLPQIIPLNPDVIGIRRALLSDEGVISGEKVREASKLLRSYRLKALMPAKRPTHTDARCP